MHISTNLLFRVYDTLDKEGATGSTCRLLLRPHYETTSCPECPVAIHRDPNDPTDTDCGLTKANPDFQSSLNQFFQLYPEYAI